MSEALPAYVLADYREGSCAARCSGDDGKRWSGPRRVAAAGGGAGVSVVW